MVGGVSAVPSSLPQAIVVMWDGRNDLSNAIANTGRVVGMTVFTSDTGSGERSRGCSSG